MRKTNSLGANALDLQAEEQFAIARMYRRTRNFNYVGIQDKEVEVGIKKKVAEELSEAGAVWAAPLNGELPDIWRDLRRDRAVSRAMKAHHKLSRLVSGLLQVQNRANHRPKVGYGDNAPRAALVPVASKAGLETSGALRLGN